MDPLALVVLLIVILAIVLLAMSRIDVGVAVVLLFAALVLYVLLGGNTRLR